MKINRSASTERQTSTETTNVAVMKSASEL